MASDGEGSRYDLPLWCSVASGTVGGACAVVLRWRDLGRTDRFALRRMTIKGTEGMLRFRLRLALARMIRLANAGER